MSKVVIKNLVVEYKDDGVGPVVVMLHGWMRDISDFDVVANILKNEYRVIRLNLPGFGGTELSKNMWSIGEYSIFVRAFLEKLDVRPFAVIGHSFGGRIILKESFGAEKIVLISAAGIKIFSWSNVFFAVLAKIGWVVSFVPPFILFRNRLKVLLYKITGSDYSSSAEMKETFKAIVDEDLSSLAKKIKNPTLLIWGEKDQTTPMDQAIKLRSLIKNSRLEIIKNAGHLSLLDSPEQVSNLIRRFLK